MRGACGHRETCRVVLLDKGKVPFQEVFFSLFLLAWNMHARPGAPAAESG